MLQTISAGKLPAFRRALSTVIEGQASERLKRTLTTPGGGIRDAQILWRPDLGLWAYFSSDPYQNKRWLCWFGLADGPSPPPVLHPAVEINLHVDPKSRTVRGRALEDRTTGGFFLGHRGGLGGGRGGELSIDDFRRAIRGISPEGVSVGDGLAEEEVFIVEDLSSRQAPWRLRGYVVECARLRTLAREGGLDAPPAEEGADPSVGFRPEYDEDGFRIRSARENLEIRRVHGRVVNALYSALPKGAYSSVRSRLKPDLYYLDRNRDMSVLFEVKAASDSQSWFTALGQLVVYGAGQTKPPVRVLVCPDRPASPLFRNAMTLLGVRLFTFEERDGGIKFPEMAAIIALVRGR